MPRAYPRVRAHVGTTRGVRAFYPFGAQSDLGIRGVVIGQELYGGGSFRYDPWFAREKGLISGPNLAMMGIIGARKSGCLKTYLHRQCVHRNRRAWVFDSKPEYAALAEALGGTVIPIRPGGWVRLNPLDALITTKDPNKRRAARLALVGDALLVTVLRRKLTMREKTILDVVLDLVVDRTHEHPTLTDLAEALLLPEGYPEAPALASMTEGEYYEHSREIAHALRELVHGDLRGMFDGPSTIDLDLNAPIVVFDISALDKDTLAVVMVCLFAWLRRALGEIDLDSETPYDMRTIVAWDEAWRVMGVPGAVDFMREAWKMARQWGIQNVAVVHGLKDFIAALSPEVREAALGLLTDSETKVIYRQDPGEEDRVREILKLNESELRDVMQAAPGEGLWKLGNRRRFVRNIANEKELLIVGSSAREVA